LRPRISEVSISSWRRDRGIPFSLQQTQLRPLCERWSTCRPIHTAIVVGIALCTGTNLLSVLFVRTSSGARGVSVAAPKIWNSLPPALRIRTTPLTSSVVTFASRPSSPLNAFFLAPQIWLLLTTAHVYKSYLLTYLYSSIISGQTLV